MSSDYPEYPQNPREAIYNTLLTWRDNFTNQTQSAFARLQPKDYIRLVVIIGGYCLLRPYIMKIGAKLQSRQHEKDSSSTGQNGNIPEAKLSPNDLRDGRKAKIAIPGVESDDEEDESTEAQAGDWGRTARLRQRKFIREQLERHEKMLAAQQEVESDKDIEEFLED